MDAKRSPISARRAFTLVEMLVVILIIGLLAGLVGAGAAAAMKQAKRFTITSEISQLSLALEKYKQDFGDYPPDFAGVDDGDATIRDNARAAVLNHLRKVFPRYKTGACPGAPAPSHGNWEGFVYDVEYASRTDVGDNSTGLDISKTPLDPSSALAFWLGGPPAPGGSTLLAGFSANPANPFARGGSRLPPSFEFDEARLQPRKASATDPNNIVYKYIPPHVSNPDGGAAPPYVYFRARSNGYNRAPAPSTGDLHDSQNAIVPFYTHGDKDTGSGTCVPYADTWREEATNKIRIMWLSPKTFQIICSGLDGEYDDPLLGFDPANPGPVHCIGTEKNNLRTNEDDNLTSFTSGTLENGVQ